MRLRRLTSAALAAVLTLSSAAYAQSAASAPPALRTALASYASQCRDAGGRLNSAAAIESADLTGDGVADFILSASHLACAMDGDPGSSFFAGSDGQEQVDIFDGANRAASAAPLYSQQVFGYVLERGVVYVVTGAQFCGGRPARSAEEAMAHLCERPLSYSRQAHALALAPLAQIRPYRPTFEYR